MRTIFKIAGLAGVTAFVSVAEGATVQPSIEKLGASFFGVNWEGEQGTTYFVQWSIDLQNWRYFPKVLNGEDHLLFRFGSTDPRFFVRLITSNIATEDPEVADFDNDGLGNLFELLSGLDPLAADTDHDGIADGGEDSDWDGSLNIGEQQGARDPEVKDHPAVKLEVVVGE